MDKANFCYNKFMNKFRLHILILLGLIILNLAFFALNLNDFFLSDDFDWLHLTQFSDQKISDYFTANYYGERAAGGSYRPMVNFIFWFNQQIGGLNPLPYHLTNLLFHIGVSFLVYLLVLVLFAKDKNKRGIAVLAAVFFSLLPNHSEAVIWIAAVADPVATFFYLLAFYGYLLFRKKLSFYWLLISVLSFIVALLTKEIAITLPLLIIVWELYEALRQNKFKFNNIVLYPFGYWLILILYFLIRYMSIGLVWGYYATAKFKFDVAAILKMFIALVTDLLFYGRLRVFLTNYFFANKIFFVLLLFLIIALILFVLRKKIFKGAFLLDVYLILSLPVLALSFNNLSDEGERYNYLPSVAFVILLSFLIWQIKNNKFIRNLIIVCLLIYFSFFLINKNYNWQLASELNKKIILEDVSQVLDLEKENYFVALPDTLSGVPLLRNGMILAINLFQPQLDFEAIVLNAYQRLDRNNFKQKVLYWGDYPTGGYIAETFDKNNWVTGFDRVETDQYIFELWNYDYPTYTSNTIRLILKNEQGGFIKAGEEEVGIIIFDQGQLKSLNKNPL